MLDNMPNNPVKLDHADVRYRFDQAADSFNDADFLHRATFDGILERLSPVVTTPSIIVDLGAATGTGTRRLAKEYRGARVVGLDSSLQMLLHGKRRRSWLSRVSELRGDANRLPLRTGCADLVVANMLLPWIDDLPGCLAEIARVLRKDGVFVFSSLGPDSLSEIRKAWSTVDQDAHVIPYPDMHDIGDALVRAGLRDPVLDVDSLSISYADTASMYRDLTRCGGRNSLQQRRRTLTGKQRFQAMESELRSYSADGRLTFRLELVYGHAWSGGPPQEAGEYRLDPAAIGRRRR